MTARLHDCKTARLHDFFNRRTAELQNCRTYYNLFQKNIFHKCILPDGGLVRYFLPIDKIIPDIDVLNQMGAVFSD